MFCGNLQGRHIRETGPKSAYFVTVEDGQVSELLPVEFDVVRWAHLQVSVDGCDRNAEALERVRQAIEIVINEGGDGRLLACRIELTGRTDIHGHLLISTEHLLAEAQAAALGFGDAVAWIERVVIATEPLLDPATLTGREDALGELHRMLGDAAADAELLSQLEADVGRTSSASSHPMYATRLKMRP